MNSNDRAILRRLLKARIKKARKLGNAGMYVQQAKAADEARVLHELANLPETPCPDTTSGHEGW